jgi:NAD+ kinase
MTALSRIGLIAKTGDPRARAVLVRVAAALEARGATLALETVTAADSGLALPACSLDTLAQRSDLLFVVGGDGTLLAAARVAAARGLPVAGLNAGRLGFLTDVAPDALEAGLAALLEGRGIAEQRTLITAELQRSDGSRVAAGLALNDAVVQKRATGRMIELATRVDGAFVCNHRADGIVVATPTGSTAYALSCGGPIIHPRVDALAIVPICPHTLSDRPIVVDGSARIVVSLAAGFAGGAQLTLDGQIGHEIAPGDSVALRRADQRLTLLHPPGHDYFEVLRDKLHWGRASAPER